MSDIAVRVENLGKLYRLGQIVGYQTLRESLTDAMSTPFRWLSRRANRRSESEAYDPSSSNSHTPRTIWALKDVSFEVKRGEAVGIIGRNGSGKTTLLKILCRVTSPTEGHVQTHGRVGSLLEVGTGFHPELTGKENIYLNGAIIGMTRAEVKRKFDAIVAFAEIDEKFLDTPVKRYSSGMYVRLAFAVAAHLEPEILLIDEVLAVGDAAFQKKCLGKMGEVTGEGRTVLFVTHNMAAVASLCGRGIVLSEGGVKTIGEVSKAIEAYMYSSDSVINSESLIDHPHREKGCKQLLTRFTMDIQNGEAFYGKPMVLKIGYSFREKVVGPQFCIIFHITGGVRAFTLVSDYQPSDIPHSLQGVGEVECKIQSLPLLPGNYFISLRLWQPGQKLDDIENVASLRVEWLERDIGQFHWDSSMGVVYVDAMWHLNDASKKGDSL
jgi:lipopolysaccharide transport system ATP-binding protein